MLFNVWNDFGQDTDNYLNQNQLEVVCERVGLRKVGKKVAGEVFEKLGLNPTNRIGYNEFIALLHSDSDASALDQCPIVTTTDTDCVGPVDESSGYDLHAHPGLLLTNLQQISFSSSFRSSCFLCFLCLSSPYF